MNLRTLHVDNYGWRLPYGTSVGSALITGAEGSGKTTLLKAVHFYGPDLLEVWYANSAAPEWVRGLATSRHSTLVTYDSALFKVDVKNPEVAVDFCLLLLVKHLARRRQAFASVLHAYTPWLAPTYEVTAQELGKLGEAHFPLVQVLDAMSVIAEETSTPSWVLFDGFDANQDLAIGLLHLLGGYWRRWGKHLRVVVTARPETVKAALRKSGCVDLSKVVAVGNEITWTAAQLWGLISTYLLNTYGAKITTMKTSSSDVWGRRCVKFPTLDQVLRMASKGGVVLSKSEIALLRRVDAGKIQSTPRQVLAIFFKEEV